MVLGMDQHRLTMQKALSGFVPIYFIMLCIMQVYDSTLLQQPVVQYLRGGPRLNNSRVWDYYFYCHIQGSTPTWQVNGTTLAGFVSHDVVGRVFSGGDNDYSYVTSLILSRPSSNTFDSILIFTTAPNRTLNITCRNKFQFSYTISINAQKQTLILNSFDASGNVFLQYLFSHYIESSIRLHMYICGVNSGPLAWLTIAQVFGFRNNIVGESTPFLSDDGTHVDPQAILIGSSPYSFVSILIVTSPGANVTCLGSMRTRTTIFFREIEDTKIDVTMSTTERIEAEDTSSNPSSSKNEVYTTEVGSTTSTVTGGRDSHVGTSKVNTTGVAYTASTSTQYCDPHIGIAVAIPLSVAVVLVPTFLLIYHLGMELKKKLKSRWNRTESRTNVPAACTLELSSSLEI